MPFPKIKLSDDSGNAVSVTDNRLNVNAYLAATPTIDIGDVSLLLGGTAASVNNGAADSTTLRVTIASDTTGVLSVDDNGSSLTVDGTVTANLSATDNAVLDDIAASLSVLDDWDDSNYANVNLNLAGSDAPTGGGAESGALRVTLANDSTGVISIDDGGNTITVDGTVGISGTVSTSATYTLGSNTYTEAATKGVPVAAVRNDTLATLANTDNEFAPLQVNASGALYVDANIGSWLETDINGTGSPAWTPTGTYNALASVMIAGVVCKDVLATHSGVTNNEYTTLQVDTQGALYTTHGMTGLASDDNNTVGTSAEKISGADGDVACKRVDIMAHPDNTGYIWIGDSAVSVNGLNGGIRLSPGDFYSMDIDNTGDVYAIATVDGENVCFNYFT
jgi:hypothetical protein